jgi:hypothetical protein
VKGCQFVHSNIVEGGVYSVLSACLFCASFHAKFLEDHSQLGTTGYYTMRPASAARLDAHLSSPCTLTFLEGEGDSLANTGL